MKIQHIIYGVFILFFIGTACSNDDDSNTNTISEQAIGVWKLSKEALICSSGINLIEDFPPCEQMGRLTINDDKTFSLTNFQIDFSNTCTQGETLTGAWEIVNDKLVVTGDDFFDFETTFFEVSDNILRLGDYDDSLPCGTGFISSHYYYEFVK